MSPLRSFVGRIPNDLVVIEDDSFMYLFETLPLEGNQTPMLFVFTGGISVRVAGFVENGKDLFEAIDFLVGFRRLELQLNEDFDDGPEDKECRRPWITVRPLAFSLSVQPLDSR